ncbi:YceI family protein [Gulosibacter sp. 10]|uniref:YceI family protein n=1 Tax=Gulosibacter sp. 10 TaxID=1255570 RepID=UPI00097EC137|nr:YceI family protein [Gulosibacter sp. 10]SJM71319.1 Protein yceI precursor [Gulosibacter sp. 10]
MAIDPQLVGTWIVDGAHSRIGFSTRHAMVTKIRGAFNTVAGEVHISPEGYTESNVQIVIQAASIDTRQPGRDDHLRGPDFFDVERFPQITFASTSIDEIADENFIVTGDLTIRDVTRPVSLPLEFVGVETDQFGLLRAGVEGTRRIDRRDWGVKWNTPLDSGGVMVSDKISLEFELSLTKQQEPAEQQAPEDQQQGW